MGLAPASSRGDTTFLSLRPHTIGAYVRTPGAASTGAGSLDQLYLTPVYLYAGESFDRIACETTAAGGAGAVARLGVYADDGTGKPGPLIFDSGTVATDPAASIRPIVIAWTVPVSGLYWIAVNTGGNANSGTFRQVTGESLLSDRATSLQSSYGYGIGNVVANGLPLTMVGSAMSPDGTFAMLGALRAA